MKPLLALDLDDLIFPFMTTIVPFLNSVRGTAFTVDDCHTFELEKTWGGDRRQALADIGTFFREHAHTVEPLDGALVAIEKLAEHFRIAVVTSRDDSLRAATHAWVSTHFAGVFESVHLCNSYVVDVPSSKRTKADVCNEIDAMALVDDSIGNVAAVAASGRRGILFGDYAWNKAAQLPPGVTRARDWDAVFDHIMETQQC